MLSNTSTPWAPWYVIPADDKPFARVAAAGVLAHTLIEIDPRFPKVSQEARDALQVTKGELEEQAPEGAARDPFEAELAEKAARKAAKAKGHAGKTEREQTDDRGHTRRAAPTVQPPARRPPGTPSAPTRRSASRASTSSTA